MDAAGGDLVHVAQHLPRAVADGDVVGVVLEKADLVEDLVYGLAKGAVEYRGEGLVGAAGQILVDARVERLQRDAVPRHDEVRNAARPPVEHRHALRVHHVEGTAPLRLRLVQRPSLVAPPVRPGEKVEPRAGGGAALGRQLARGGRRGEDVDGVAAARQGGVEGEGVALHATGGGGQRPLAGKDGDAQVGGRGTVGGEV